jgi:hypothetical protein
MKKLSLDACKDSGGLNDIVWTGLKENIELGGNVRSGAIIQEEWILEWLVSYCVYPSCRRYIPNECQLNAPKELQSLITDVSLDIMNIVTV